MAAQVKVVSTANPNRVLFEGDAASAEKWLEDNFPRVHIPEGTRYGEEEFPADAHIVHSATKRTAYIGGEHVPSDEKGFRKSAPITTVTK